MKNKEFKKEKKKARKKSVEENSFSPALQNSEPIDPIMAHGFPFKERAASFQGLTKEEEELNKKLEKHRLPKEQEERFLKKSKNID